MITLRLERSSTVRAATADRLRDVGREDPAAAL